MGGEKSAAEEQRSVANSGPISIWGKAMFLLVPAVILVLDQTAKALTLRHLAPDEPIHVIDGLVALRLGLNPGLAFGLLRGLDESWRWIISLVSIGALIPLARLAYGIATVGSWSARLGIGLVFGGALGNLIDRARFGGVVDFIDVYWRTYHWPAFNAADSAITVGVILVAATMMTEPKGSPSVR